MVRNALAIAALVVLVLGVAGWGWSGDAGSAPDDRRTTGIQVQSSQYGDVLFDAKGFVLYLFTKDGENRSRCYGECAEAWPPFLKKGSLEALGGVDASALGTTRRRDGSRQVTYHGHPLYYYEHDDRPGQILCHDVTEFGGDWLVVQPDGQPAP